MVLDKYERKNCPFSSGARSFITCRQVHEPPSLLYREPHRVNLITDQWLLALVATLVVAAWLASACGSPAFGRTFPREGRAVRLAFLGWCGVSFGSWWYLPSVLPWLLLVPLGAGGIVALVDFRARRHAHDSPPGRLSVLQGIRALARRDHYLREFDRHGAFFKMSQFGRPTICVLGLERIGKLIKGHSDYLGPSTLPISKSVEGAFLRYMPPETHAIYGRLFRIAMTGPFAARQTDRLDHLCEHHLQRSSAGESSPYPALQAIARRSLNCLLLGFDADTEEEARFDELAQKFSKAGISRSLVRRDQETLAEMREMLLKKVDSNETGPEGIAGTSVLARLRQQDSTMPDRVCLDNMIVMHRIATGNVSSLLSWLLYRWGSEPAITAEILDEDPETREASLRLFLAETLRTSQSEYLYRRVAREFEFEGHRFPEGWLIRGCVWESHRTAEGIDEPARFRLRREAARPNRRQFTPLGMGAHACNGGEVNELICLAFLKRMAHATDVRVTAADPLQRQMRHWSHWQPNAAMQLKLGVAE